MRFPQESAAAAAPGQPRWQGAISHQLSISEPTPDSSAMIWRAAHNPSNAAETSLARDELRVIREKLHDSSTGSDGS